MIPDPGFNRADVVAVEALEIGLSALISQVRHQVRVVLVSLLALRIRAAVDSRLEVRIVQFDYSGFHVLVLGNYVPLDHSGHVRSLAAVTALVPRRFVAEMLHVVIARAHVLES